MSTVRTLVIVAVLAAIGYGVHVTLHTRPPGDPPPEAIESMVDNPPDIEVPSLGAQATTPPPTNVGPSVGGVAPPFSPSSDQTPPPLEEAPPFGASVGVPPVSQAPVQTPPLGDAPRYAPPSASPSGAPTAAPTGPAPGVPAGAPNTVPVASESSASAMAPPSASNVAPAAHEQHESHNGHRASSAAMSGSGSRGDGPAVVRNVHAEFQMAMERIKAQLDQGQLAEAHLALSAWYENQQLTADERAQLMDLLDRVAGTVVYSRISILEPPYEVQPGDTLQQIAQYYDVPWQLLAKINGIADPNHLQAGQKLKVVRGKFSATIDKDEHLLTLWLNGRYAGRFPIGLGRDYSTPEGEFVVQNKVENPTYYGPDRVIAAEDPNNPLGERWIDLGNQIGIHGTNDPSSIGRDASRGCIRMSPRDIEDVYDILSIGSRVVIRR